MLWLSRRRIQDRMIVDGRSPENQVLAEIGEEVVHNRAMVGERILKAQVTYELLIPLTFCYTKWLV